MRRALVSGVDVLEIGIGNDPVPAPGEVVVAVEACGICATDRHIFHGIYPMTFPITLGHEYSGTVAEVGPNVRTLAVGDRVAVDPNVVCGVCSFCRRGLVHLCAALTPLGIVRSGGYAEFSSVPEQNAYRMPDSMSFEAGGMLEPLACSIRGIQLAEIELGDTAVVFGAGPMGVCLVQLLRLRGASTIVVADPDSARRELALTFGADVAVEPGDEVNDVVMQRTEGLGADVAFEASGNSAVAKAALTVVRRGGTVMWFGCCAEFDTIAVNPFWVNDAEVTIRGSFNNPFTHATALNLVATGRVDVDSMVTDRIPLERLGDAMVPGNFPGSMKVTIMPGIQS